MLYLILSTVIFVIAMIILTVLNIKKVINHKTEKVYFIVLLCLFVFIESFLQSKFDLSYKVTLLSYFIACLIFCTSDLIVKKIARK